MALHLTGEEFETLRDYFKDLDEDEDGKITRSELKAYFEVRSVSRSDDDVDTMMRMMDSDVSGSVEFPEFLEMLAFFEYNKGISEWQLRQMFRSKDKDGNGVLSADEIKLLFSMFTDWNTVPHQKEIEDIIKSLDNNDDGKIDYEEFIKKINFKLLK